MPAIRLLWSIVVMLSLVTSVAAADQKPNIIFIEVDDLCSTYSSPWGSKTSPTPALARLAKEGFVFDHAMCQGVMCGPSRNSLICGKYPHQLGFYQNGDLRKLPRNSWLLPKALQKAGYYTAWVGKSHLKPFFASKKDGDTFKPFFGFDHELHTLGRGLISDDDRDGDDNADNPYLKFLRSQGLLEKFQADAAAKRPSTLTEDEYLDGWFTKNAEDFLKGYKADKPLFLWVNYSVPHEPHDVPSVYHTPFAAAKMPGRTKPSNFTHPENLIERTKTFRNDRLAEEFQRGFHANIAFMDTQVNRLLSALDKKGMLDNSWIVFFSDHGAMAGSQGLIHKHTLFRSVTQPSLIVRAPKGAGGGTRVTQPVELLDLLPTTLAIAGGTGEKAPNGVSLLPLFEGKAIVKPHVFAEIEKWVVVSDGQHRLIRSVDRARSFLFNDSADPENLTDLADKQPELVKRLGTAIDDWQARTGERLKPKSQE
jgi:arylsulfatase A-like enzyme